MIDLDDIERDLLVAGLDDWIGLWRLLSHIRDADSGAAEGERRAGAMERIRRLLQAGYVEAGALPEVDRFEAWAGSTEDVLERIERRWSALDREPTLGDVVWFQNTATGDELARSWS